MSDDGGKKVASGTGADPGGDGPRADLALDIGRDGLTASVSGKVVGIYNPEQIAGLLEDLLAQHSIQHGIDQEGLNTACEELSAGGDFSGLVIARGDPPQPGRPGEIQVMTPPPPPRKGRKAPDGTVDFKDTGPLPTVKAGTVLARLVPPTPGLPGRDVQGRPIPPPEAEAAVLEPGYGVELAPDGRIATAKVAGVVRRKDAETFEVLPVSRVEGDLEPESGQANHAGLLLVEGQVCQGVKVKALGLDCTGVDSRALVSVSGDVSVDGGVVGATLKVGGNVSARYLRDCTVAVGGDLYVENEMVNCRVVCHGEVIVSNGEGRISNSHIEALWGASAGDIICSRVRSSQIRIGPNEEMSRRIVDMRKAREALYRERERIHRSMADNKEELEGVESELRLMISRIKDPDYAADRENFLGQVSMMKPLREGLLDDIREAEIRLGVIAVQLRKLGKQLAKIEKAGEPGSVKLVAKGLVEVGTLINGPHASAMVENNRQGLVAVEEKDRDQGSGRPTISMKLQKLPNPSAESPEQ